MTDLPQQIDQIIRDRKLFSRGRKILIAVSGGVDSMVLLHVLHELSPKYKWNLTVAHLNHQLRGRSSDADERLVTRTAKKLGLGVVVGRANVKNLARTGKLSVEMAARKARHEFLAQTAARLKISHIALAHHADDQVELFFLRLLRGSGSEGLAGMRWRNPSPADSGIQLLRPLLEHSKKSLLNYASEKKIPFREDASNESHDIQRNLIRHELLPLLRRKYQPALQRTILRVMEILRAESEFGAAAAEDWLADRSQAPVAKNNFATLPVALQRRCIQSQLTSHGIPADFALVERLRTAPRKPFTIVPQLAVLCDGDGRLHFRDSGAPVADSSPIEVDLGNGAGETNYDGRKISWAIKPMREFCRPQLRAGREIFDADKIGPRITLRHWLPGDRFQPIGMSRSVKLQDLFVNQKLPRERRHDLIVAVTARNELFWVENLRISEQFKLTKHTTHQLTWRWKVGKNARLRVSAHHVRLAQLNNVRRKQN